MFEGSVWNKPRVLIVISYPYLLFLTVENRPNDQYIKSQADY